MGKKSLFEPTGPAEPKAAPGKKAKKAPARKKNIVAEPAVTEAAAPAAAPSPPPEPQISAAARADVVDDKDAVIAAETATPTPAPEPAPFDHDPLVGTNLLLKAAAATGGLILLILIVSMVNAGNYYVRESRGAVEIWKGDFSPAGQDRVMVLHGVRWKGKVKDSYSRDEVFSFAAMSYLDKAASLAVEPVAEEFDRIVSYLDRSLELIPEERRKTAATVINQARQQVIEAKILQASGEREALALAGRKLEAAGGALNGLVLEMSGKAGP